MARFTFQALMVSLHFLNSLATWFQLLEPASGRRKQIAKTPEHIDLIPVAQLVPETIESIPAEIILEPIVKVPEILPQLVEEVVQPSAPAQFKKRTTDELFEAAMDLFDAFMAALQEDLHQAKILMRSFFESGSDGYRLIVNLQELINRGDLDEYLTKDLVFTWHDENRVEYQSEMLADVPEKKRAQSFVYALFATAKKRVEATKAAEASAQEAASRRYNGGAGAKTSTGKTARVAALKGTREQRDRARRDNQLSRVGPTGVKKSKKR